MENYVDYIKIFNAEENTDESKSYSDIDLTMKGGNIKDLNNIRGGFPPVLERKNSNFIATTSRGSQDSFLNIFTPEMNGGETVDLPSHQEVMKGGDETDTEIDLPDNIEIMSLEGGETVDLP